MLAFEKESDFSEQAIKSFALKMDIAPGIIVGRLQNEGKVKHNMLNSLKEHYVITT